MIRIGVPAMSYVEQWNAIAARIRALRDAADLYAQFLIAQNGQDTRTNAHHSGSAPLPDSCTAHKNREDLSHLQNCSSTLNYRP
jgi:hypothetical protein